MIKLKQIFDAVFEDKSKQATELFKRLSEKDKKEELQLIETLIIKQSVAILIILF